VFVWYITLQKFVVPSVREARTTLRVSWWDKKIKPHVP